MNGVGEAMTMAASETDPGPCGGLNRQLGMWTPTTQGQSTYQRLKGLPGLSVVGLPYRRRVQEISLWQGLSMTTV